MLVLKGSLGGAALAAMFQVYMQEMEKDPLASSLAPKLIALTVIFLISNLVHWLVFRDPTDRTFRRKLTFSLALWTFFSLLVVSNAITFHRAWVNNAEPTARNFALLFAGCAILLGIPLALLNCAIANWSEPAHSKPASQ
jgi:hypothetical protein